MKSYSAPDSNPNQNKDQVDCTAKSQGYSIYSSRPFGEGSTRDRCLFTLIIHVIRVFERVEEFKKFSILKGLKN